MIAVFTSFSISRGKIFSQKIQKFSICKNAVILFQTCKVFFRFSLKLTTVKVFYNVPQKKNCECVVIVNNLFQRFFQYSHSCKQICRSGFLPEFLFFTFELILISARAQYADCRDGGFSIYCKGPPKYLHSRSLNKKYILMALNWKHIIKLENGINDWHLTISGQGVPLFHLCSTYNSLFKYLFWEHCD